MTDGQAAKRGQEDYRRARKGIACPHPAVEKFTLDESPVGIVCHLAGRLLGMTEAAIAGALE